jgi:hypothetical protein
MIDAVGNTLDPSKAPPLPAALVHVAEPVTAGAPDPKRHRLIWKTVQAVMLLIIGGVVSLAVGLITGHVQVGAENQQSQSSHQFQLWQQLQSQARDEATLTLEIYSFADQCSASQKMGWQQCAGLDPNYNSWVDAADQMDTTGVNIDDIETVRLARTLASLSNRVVLANSPTVASVAQAKIWPAYEALLGRLGVLIRNN